jgi:hypothetical protein
VTNSSVGHTEGVVQLWDGTAWAVKRAANVPGPYTSAASESGPEILGFDGGAQQTVSGSREVSTVTPFGTGCPGPNGIPTLAVSPASWVQAPIADGNYFVLEWSGISPSPLAWPYFILGFDRVVWSGTLLPYDLGAIGMPGCMLNESIDWLSWYTNFSPTSLGIPIPGYPNLIGLHFFVQVAGFELLGPNGPYVSMTPSLDCKIGVGY